MSDYRCIYCHNKLVKANARNVYECLHCYDKGCDVMFYPDLFDNKYCVIAFLHEDFTISLDVEDNTLYFYAAAFKDTLELPLTFISPDSIFEFVKRRLDLQVFS